MRRLFASAVLGLLTAAPLCAQPVEFDPSDFGKIVVAPRQSAGTGIVLEQAFGDYQNEPVISYGEKSIARRLGHPVGRLDILYKNGKTGYCTAFIVDTEHLVTNHHCIPGIGDVGAQAAQFVAGYIDPAHPDSAEKFQVAVEPVETNTTLDYSVLRVFGDPSARYGEVKLANADPEPSEFLWIIGHPQGQAQHISREGCAAGDPPVSTEGKVVHTCDTLGGNSGSPVFRISDRAVVALHHAGDNRTGFNFAIPMTRILKNSKVLKASATETKGACEVLWSAAEQHGCLGYKTFLDQCGTHPLAALARGLADQSCNQPGPTPDPDRHDLSADIAEAIGTAKLRRRAVEQDLETAQGHLRGASNILVKMDSEKAGAKASREAGSAAVAALWDATLTDTRKDTDWIKSRVDAMPRFLSQIDTSRGFIERAETKADLSVALNEVDTAAKDARNWLTAIAARRKTMDKVYPDISDQAALILHRAAGGKSGGPDPRILKARIEEAMDQAAEARVQTATNAVTAERLLQAYEQIIATAYANGTREQNSGAPGSDLAADHWQAIARGLAGEARRLRSRVAGMKDFEAEIDKAVAQLRIIDREEEVNAAAARVTRALSTSNDWLRQVNARHASAETKLAEATQQASVLLESATPQRTATATRCLELAMPTFALDGFDGVAGADLQIDLALSTCKAATAESSEPAVYFGLARAHLAKKQYVQAFRLLNNPQMQDFIPAVWSLGSLYNGGFGVTKNRARALELYRRAAEAGYPRGKFSLGVYYSYGWEVRADPVRAAALLVEAVADGYDYTITQLPKLSKATIREVQRDLATRGYLGAGDADGAFGPKTRRALQSLAAAAR